MNSMSETIRTHVKFYPQLVKHNTQIQPVFKNHVVFIQNLSSDETSPSHLYVSIHFVKLGKLHP